MCVIVHVPAPPLRQDAPAYLTVGAWNAGLTTLGLLGAGFVTGFERGFAGADFALAFVLTLVVAGFDTAFGFETEGAATTCCLAGDDFTTATTFTAALRSAFTDLTAARSTGFAAALTATTLAAFAGSVFAARGAREC